MSKRVLAEPSTIPDNTQSALKLWVVLSRAHASISAHAVAHVADHGLSLTEFAILEALYHRGRMVLGEIQRRILVSSGGITFLVDRLAEKGLVVRQECPEDRRAKYVSLTREGTKLIRELFPSHAHTLAESMHGLTSEEQEEATRLLRTLGLTASGGGLPPSPNTLRRAGNGIKSAKKRTVPREP
jgi:MarR family 2-MHQ and catechol resistance regulon transcriptional repressor